MSNLPHSILFILFRPTVETDYLERIAEQIEKIKESQREPSWIAKARVEMELHLNEQELKELEAQQRRDVINKQAIEIRDKIVLPQIHDALQRMGFVEGKYKLEIDIDGVIIVEFEGLSFFAEFSARQGRSLALDPSYTLGDVKEQNRFFVHATSIANEFVKLGTLSRVRVWITSDAVYSPDDYGYTNVIRNQKIHPYMVVEIYDYLKG